MAFILFDKQKPKLEKLEKLSKRMSRKFKVRYAIIKINPRRRGSVYQAPGIIVISGRTELPIEHLLHEFAHHIDYHKYNIKYSGIHGKVFQRILWKLVMWYYKGDPELYNWDFEYPRVNTYGIKRIQGLIKRRIK